VDELDDELDDVDGAADPAAEELEDEPPQPVSSSSAVAPATGTIRVSMVSPHVGRAFSGPPSRPQPLGCGAPDPGTAPYWLTGADQGGFAAFHPHVQPCVNPDRLDERPAAVGIEPFAVNAARYQ
jgi:hypothetical protein